MSERDEKTNRLYITSTLLIVNKDKDISTATRNHVHGLGHALIDWTKGPDKDTESACDAYSGWILSGKDRKSFWKENETLFGK